ncbi:5'-nucleotidase [Cordyceps militaris CM01]|uniref:5'-nucleotidase n=1 Tax=Cordyceps militaris (strain CM01) TaxID=983644 RepID=G3J554_CORMM|nr:5'-nucleotidase [Cordyceps militaris CM01]EGX95968.1 5'-nucleotidase [Cordyceps militaris CM01]
MRDIVHSRICPTRVLTPVSKARPKSCKRQERRHNYLNFGSKPGRVILLGRFAGLPPSDGPHHSALQRCGGYRTPNATGREPSLIKDCNCVQYHISDSELVAKFASVLEDPSLATGDGNTSSGPILRVFSGDAFSPSLEAAVLRGDHMAPLLDGLGIDVACYGNHDFDFGEDRLVELVSQTRFPWTLANAVAPTHDAKGGRLLAGAHEYVVKELEHPATVAKRVATRLRLEESCDVVIAVTHMRLVEDLETLNSTLSGPERIDLILGGHDHYVVRRDPSDDNANPEVLQSGLHEQGAAMTECDGDFRIIKSGTDWRGLSILQLRLGSKDEGERTILDMSLRQIRDLKKISSYEQIPASQATLAILQATHDRIEQVVTQPLFRTASPLDGRSHIIRSQETNLGNMLADAVRAFYDTDIGFVNSGAVRCDRIVECDGDAPLCIRDVIEISPFDNAFVVKRVSGRVLSEALENSVSDAHTDGRFLQLCGLTMRLDWRRPEGSRVSEILFHPRQGRIQPLDADRMYTVTMIDFIASGFDGYTCFQDCETLVDTEGAITDTNMLLEIFKVGREDASESGIADQHAEGIQRARAAVITGYHSEDALPIVNPVVESRIKVMHEANL